MTEVAFYEAKHLLTNGHAYYEFGVAGGYNLYRAWTVGRRICADVRYYGFDSFEGMPADADYSKTHESWKPGAFSVDRTEVIDNLIKAGCDYENVDLYKGFFAERLPELSKRTVFRPAGVVVVDCDLYESTIPVLEFIRPLLVVGTIILLDDWDCPGLGEQRAWLEFEEKYPEIETEEFDYGRFSRHARVVGI